MSVRASGCRGTLGRHTLKQRPMVTSRSAYDHDLLESVETARVVPDERAIAASPECNLGSWRQQ